MVDIKGQVSVEPKKWIDRELHQEDIGKYNSSRFSKKVS